MENKCPICGTQLLATEDKFCSMACYKLHAREITEQEFKAAKQHAREIRKKWEAGDFDPKKQIKI